MEGTEGKKEENVIIEFHTSGGGARGSESGKEVHRLGLSDLPNEYRNALADAFSAQNPELAQKMRATGPEKDWKSRVTRAARHQVRMQDILGGAVLITAAWLIVNGVKKYVLPRLPWFGNSSDGKITTSKRIVAQA